MKIGLIGYGKMGKEIERLAAERGWEVGFKATAHSGALSQSEAGSVDVGIHFARAEGVVEHVERWAGLGKPLVIGTTGWTSSLEKVRSIVETSGIGLVYGANFSTGIHLFARLVAQAGSLVDRVDEYDIGIHESHHSGKADSPSGTALMLGSILLERVQRKSELLKDSPRSPVKPGQLQISSARIGKTIGTHSVILDSSADVIELTHRAKNRTGFALGALLAAEWIRTRKGFHNVDEVMNDLLGS